MYIDFEINIKSRKALLLSHGLFSDKDQPRFRKLKEKLKEKNLSYLFFDYPGHGKSEKVPLNALEFRETFLKMCRILIKNNIEELVILAESLGSLIVLSAYEFLINNFRKVNFIFVGPLLKPKIPYFIQKEHIMKKILNGEIVEIGKGKYKVNIDFLKSLFELKIYYPKEAVVFLGLNDFVININEVKKIIEEEKLNWKIIYLEDDHVISKNFDFIIEFIINLLR